MKRILVLFLAVILCFGMSVTAFADDSSEESFVQSPERDEDVILIDAILPEISGMLELIIKSYKNREEALDAYEDLLVEAFDIIADAKDLSELVSNIAELFNQKIENLAVSNLFVAYTQPKASVATVTAKSTAKAVATANASGDYTIIVKCDNLENFEGLLNYTGGKWSVVENAHINENGYLEFTTESLDVFAVVASTEGDISEDTSEESVPADDSSDDTDSPPTGDEFPWMIVILGVAAVIVIIVLITTGKKRK